MGRIKLFHKFTLCLLLAFSVDKIVAQDKPIQLALFNPVQLFNENTSITGLRINPLYGKNTTVSGLDWGLVNHMTSGVSKGVQFGLVGLVEADYVGVNY